MKFTNVFYEPTEQDAKRRLENLRQIDRYPEIRAYILKERNQFRVLRSINYSAKETTRGAI